MQIAKKSKHDAGRWDGNWAAGKSDPGVAEIVNMFSLQVCKRRYKGSLPLTNHSIRITGSPGAQLLQCPGLSSAMGLTSSSDTAEGQHPTTHILPITPPNCRFYVEFGDILVAKSMKVVFSPQKPSSSFQMLLSPLGQNLRPLDTHNR